MLFVVLQIAAQLDACCQKLYCTGFIQAAAVCHSLHWLEDAPVKGEDLPWRSVGWWWSLWCQRARIMQCLLVSLKPLQYNGVVMLASFCLLVNTRSQVPT